MNCMKCGREISQSAVFCESCLADMQHYPVKPDVVVKLPNRNAAVAKKAATRRRAPQTDKEKIVSLKRRLRVLSILLIVLLLLLGVTSFFAVNAMLRDKAPLPGQNYSTVTTKPQETTADE